MMFNPELPRDEIFQLKKIKENKPKKIVEKRIVKAVSPVKQRATFMIPSQINSMNAKIRHLFHEHPQPDDIEYDTADGMKQRQLMKAT